jgi:hypothetical protein
MRLVGPQHAAFCSLVDCAQTELAAWRRVVEFLRRRADAELQYGERLSTCWAGSEDVLDGAINKIAGFFNAAGQHNYGAGEVAREQAEARERGAATGHVGSLRDGLAALEVGLHRGSAAAAAAAEALRRAAAATEEGLRSHDAALHEFVMKGDHLLRELDEVLTGLGRSRDAYHRSCEAHAVLEAELQLASAHMGRGDPAGEQLATRTAGAEVQRQSSEADYRTFVDTVNCMMANFYQIEMPELMTHYRAMRAERVQALREALGGCCAALLPLGTVAGSVRQCLEVGARQMDQQADDALLTAAALPLCAPLPPPSAA